MTEAERILDKFINNTEYFKNRLETKFKDDIRLILRLLGVYSMILPPSSIDKQDVTPDLLCMLPVDSDYLYKHFFLEIKRTVKGSKTKERVIQEVSNNRLRKYAKVFVVADWKEFKEALIDLGLLR